MINKLNEDGVPVTTTNNAGVGLTDPKLPIKPKNILKRYRDIKKKPKS
jgi:hypothetical protein